MKKVIMFPGQGSQYKGMGKSLFAKYKAETRLASTTLGYDLETLCLKDPNNLLVKTQYTQPALYVVNSFYYNELKQRPDYLIGHSLGEYNALLAAGVFDFATGLKLVQKRGELMAAASGGGMAAVQGLSVEEVKQKLKEKKYYSLDIACYNTPSQIVLSGKKEDINKVVKDFSAQQIKIISLRVGAAFHSRYMEPATEKFSDFIKAFTFNKLKIPVIANVTAQPYEIENVSELLCKQIVNPIKWTDTICYLVGQNVGDFQEVGRSILTKMTDEIRKATPRTQVKHQPEILKKAKPKKQQKNGLATRLGCADFRKDYGLSYNYLIGAMYRGTSSSEMVIRAGQAGMLAYLGTGGMSLKEISENIVIIQAALSSGEPYGMNLLHQISNPDFEMRTVELFLEKGIKNIEIGAVTQMTEPLIYFHVTGLEKDKTVGVKNNHRILAKVARPEVAEAFMRPAPEKILNRLLQDGKITQEQASLAKSIPVSYDICVTADSGGHTDGGVAIVLLPAIQQLRNDLQQQYNYPKKIRLGLAGGIGTPQSAACAFVMGADFVLTGSINQCTVEAGTSNLVKDLLENINVQDTTYAPAGDMFEIGAKVQVLRKGVLFPARANKLYNLYTQYNSLDEIPKKIIAQLEGKYFKRTIAEVWEETKAYFRKRDQVSQIEKAESIPRYKMALVFRWYFGLSTRVAFAGDLENKVNFQVHTGPALGAFNQWVKGTDLESWRNRHVDEIGEKLMEATADLLKSSLDKIVR